MVKNRNCLLPFKLGSTVKYQKIKIQMTAIYCSRHLIIWLDEIFIQSNKENVDQLYINIQKGFFLQKTFCILHNFNIKYFLCPIFHAISATTTRKNRNNLLQMQINDRYKFKKKTKTDYIT